MQNGQDKTELRMSSCEGEREGEKCKVHRLLNGGAHFVHNGKRVLAEYLECFER